MDLSLTQCAAKLQHYFLTPNKYTVFVHLRRKKISLNLPFPFGLRRIGLNKKYSEPVLAGLPLRKGHKKGGKTAASTVIRLGFEPKTPSLKGMCSTN